jgi:hypothetical protein
MVFRPAAPLLFSPSTTMRRRWRSHTDSGAVPADRKLDVNSFLLDVVLPGSDLCFNSGVALHLFFSVDRSRTMMA